MSFRRVGSSVVVLIMVLRDETSVWYLDLEDADVMRFLEEWYHSATAQGEEQQQ
jgi:hypothetical protein